MLCIFIGKLKLKPLLNPPKEKPRLVSRLY